MISISLLKKWIEDLKIELTHCAFKISLGFGSVSEYENIQERILKYENDLKEMILREQQTNMA